ncbi:MAG: hypothetical protein DCF19_19880 [Pseudanabaena frigida]|uniref:DUF4159 domain-containing protein n=1 Tax=Pseudanabaena frigida TaxID=945775 RepID=A0A2W4VXL4_9CYAN|nr:MAG: hypothetical protein DCF19_19880 [Pseudanabaena frigida]
MNDFPYPEIKSFERLQVSDGLMINSERWRLAHEYHQQRQNMMYQSLFLPGIICGLGVAPIPAPEDLPAKFRDGRWVQIQPGIAIDLEGNFIVVPEPLDFRISSEAYDLKVEMVYLVLSYVDPAKLKRASSNEILVETFRVNEKTDLPIDTDIEICRIAIAGGKLEIQRPVDIFSPSVSQLDMRYRLLSKLRPQNLIRIACFSDDSNQKSIQQNFKLLGQALTSLAPHLSTIDPIDSLNILTELELSSLTPYHLIYLTGERVLALNESTQLALQQYVALGGVILIEASIRNTKLENLLAIQQELQSASTKLKKTMASQFSNQPNASTAEQSSIQVELQSELDAIAIEVNSQTQNILNSFNSHIPQQTPLIAFSDLERDHLLRSQPFLFSSLPAISDQSIQVLAGGGVIIVLGDLSPVWGGQSDLELTRENIRTCQELGINILNYAAQRYAIAMAMQVNPKYIDTNNSLIEPEQRRVTNMIDKSS